jgi:hypothetical protein
MNDLVFTGQAIPDPTHRLNGQPEKIGEFLPARRQGNID